MKQQLRILMVDDSEADASLILIILRREGYEVISKLVDTPDAMLAALQSQDWDIITSDHAMPQFSAPAALELARQHCSNVPFFIVSGEIDLNLAVSLMRNGAKDYIKKSDLPRLIPAIERELREEKLQKTAQEVQNKLEYSEIKYRRLFETAQDGILILDADTGQINDVNPFLLKMLGYSKDNFLEKKLWDIGVFHDEKKSKKLFLEMQKRGFVRYKNLPLETSTGKTISVEFISNIYLVNTIKVAQCNIRDMTEHVVDERKIHKLNQELERRVLERTLQLETLNKELESFSYAVSHDLHAPLRRIMAFTDALKEAITCQKSEEGVNLIEKIRVSTQRMNSLIGALLELAHLSRQPIDRQLVDLSAIAQRIAKDLLESQPNRKVVFKIAGGIHAYGDILLLRSVLENLLGNAWKYTSRHVSALIEFGTILQADGRTAYFVRDDGAGFNTAYSDKLFGAFQRMHSDQEFPGLGIGLATVKRIILRHNGQVWVESVVGKGTTFFFTLGIQKIALDKKNK
jgi:PAS domain S-box-containing protein